MNNYIVKTIFTKKECDKILEMDTSFVNRYYHTKPFNQTWINGVLRPAGDNILDEVINAEDWVYDRLKEYWDNDYAKCNGMWPLIKKVYSKKNEFIDQPLHTDSVKGVKRVAISVQLNDPKEYEGGEFQIFDWGYNDTGLYEDYTNEFGVVEVKRNVGDAIIFPVLIPHGVTPITRGTRKVLITWFLGEKLNW